VDAISKPALRYSTLLLAMALRCAKLGALDVGH